MKRIIVGVDGSTGAEAALRWAIEEADRHDAAVVAVLAWDYLNQHHADGGHDFDPAYGLEEARAALHAGLRAVNPARPVEEQVMLELPAKALVESSADADLLVVGSRGLDGFKGMLLGSVSERVIERARCPVAVVRESGAWPQHGSIVVGIDVSETARRALRWAADEARARRASLHVVHAWRRPRLAVPGNGPILTAMEDAARSVLQTALEDPVLTDLHVEGHMPPTGASQAMLSFAGDASLFVVGSHGLGRLGRVVLGTTTRQLAHHSPCPLVVVPAGD